MTRQAPESLLTLFDRLRAHAAAGTTELGEESSVAVASYCSPQRAEDERATLFRRYPLIVGHGAELAPGSARAVDAAGTPVLLTRSPGGTLRAFLNVCRHRGMRLLEANGACAKQAITCPYHGWTYALDGRLKHFLHPEAFPALDPVQHGLVALPCAERHGLIWLQPSPGPALDIPAFLGPIDAELAWFIGDSVLYRRNEVLREANWKLIIDAFLDGYHIRVLHRDTIYPFFVDALAASDAVPPHIRSAAARRKLGDVVKAPREQWDLREHCTFTHYVFPNSVFIFHPDYASAISVYPEGPARLRWVHQMLIPASQHTEARKPHWEKTFQLIEQTVFQREDLYAAEGIQAGLRSGANEALKIGRLEYPIRFFHDAIESALRK